MKRFNSTSIIAGLMVAGVVAGSAIAAQPGAHAAGNRRIHPTVQGAFAARQKVAARKTLATNSNTTLAFGGGVGGSNGVGVMSGQAKVYLIFYGNQWGASGTDANGYTTFGNDSAGAGVAAQKMFKGIGTNGELWQAELTQWCDGTSVAVGATACPSQGANRIPYQQNILAGVWYDNAAASPAQATATDLANEAIKAAQHFGNTTAASNRYAYYVILSPTGTNPDNYKSPTQGYCAWHDHVLSYGTSPYGDMAFSNQPYNIDVGASCGTNFVNAGAAGKLDGYTMTLGHEWQEMMSDQFPESGATSTAPLYGGWTNRDATSSWFQYENSDECAWLYPGTTGGAANVAFATGTFAQQASWSNDTNSCAITHPIVTNGDANSAPVANFTFTTSSLTATFTDASTDAENNIATRSWNFGDGVTSTTTNPSHTYATAGTYSVTETVTDSGGLSSTKTQSVTVSGGGGGGTTTVLTKGVPVTGQSAALNGYLYYKLDVPAGATNLTFNISGGTGDADLYVKAGAAPTDSVYDCRPFKAGNTETCSFATPIAGTYYVALKAFSAFSGVTIVGDYTVGGGGGGSCGGSVLCNGTPVTLPAGALNTWSPIYTIDVPAGKTSVVFNISGGTGDADLYVQLGSAPTLSSYLCRPFLSGNTETCTFNAPTAGKYYVGTYAFSAYSGVSLKATISP